MAGGRMVAQRRAPSNPWWLVRSPLVSGVEQTTPGLAAPSRRFPVGPGRPRTLLIVAGVLVTAAGVWLRFYCPSALWLDETISVNISRLPLSQIPAALRQDGAPPLYYVLLHYWMGVFGEGDLAVRGLSGLISVLTLPVFWFAGRRVGGRRVAWATYFLAVSSPFLIQYATTTRMYSLMVLLGVLGFLAIARALEAPTWRRFGAVALVTAAVLYTHYWGLYVVGMTGLWLLYQMWRERRGLPTRQDAKAVRGCFGAMILGAVLFAPWAPIFFFQTLHTGTPWASAAGPADVLGVFSDFAGITGPWAHLLAFFYVVAILLGVFVRSTQSFDHDAVDVDDPDGDPRLVVAHRLGAVDDDGHGGEDERLIAAGLDGPQAGSIRSAARRGLDRAVGFAGFGPGGSAGSGRSAPITTFTLGTNPTTLPVFGVLTGTLLVAMVIGAIVQAAFVARYAAVVIPLFLLLVAVGTTMLGDRRLVAGALAVMCVAGLFTGYGDNGQPRTEAVKVAQILNAEAKPGDLIVYCPDQLAPAVDRLLKVPQVTELTFPREIGPQRVDWIDYLSTIDHTDVATFAQNVRANIGVDSSVWLVWNRSYTGFGHDCGDLETWLSYFQGTGTTLLNANPRFFENEILTRYPTVATSS
jgi:4-amino-4-deoxy-L-arabinose transferase-like glycosyltransferase